MLLFGYDGIYHPNSTIYTGEAERQPQPPQLGIAKPPEQPAPSYPTHLVVESWPLLAITLNAEADKFTSYGVNNFHNDCYQG